MSKYGPFTISTRERSRLAWRSRVDAATKQAVVDALAKVRDARKERGHR